MNAWQVSFVSRSKTSLQLLALLICLIGQIPGIAQDIHILKSERHVVNSVFIVADQNSFEEVFAKIKKDYPASSSYSFFLFNGSALSNDSIRLFLNNYLNTVSLCKNHMHLMIIGKYDFVKNRGLFNPDIFASVNRLIKEPNSNYIDMETGMTMDFNVVIQSTNNTYTWDYIIRDIQARNNQCPKVRSGSTQLSLMYKPTLLTSSYDSYNPNVVNTYSLGLARKTKSRFSYYANIGWSSKIPKVQDDIQSLVFNQVDRESIINGEAGEEEIEIDHVIKGHVFKKLSFGLGIDLFSKEKTTLTLNTGLSRTSFIGIEEHIDTTFVVDFSEVSFGSGSGLDIDGFSPDDLNEQEEFSIKDNTIITWSYPVSLNLDLKISPRMLFSSQINYEIDSNTFTGGDTFNQINLGLGFKFVFNKSGRRTCYDYIRLLE